MTPIASWRMSLLTEVGVGRIQKRHGGRASGRGTHRRSDPRRGGSAGEPRPILAELAGARARAPRTCVSVDHWPARACRSRYSIPVNRLESTGCLPCPAAKRRQGRAAETVRLAGRCGATRALRSVRMYGRLLSPDGCMAVHPPRPSGGRPCVGRLAGSRTALGRFGSGAHGGHRWFRSSSASTTVHLFAGRGVRSGKLWPAIHGVGSRAGRIHSRNGLGIGKRHCPDLKPIGFNPASEIASALSANAEKRYHLTLFRG
jgi:hypothetical protein